MFNGFDDIIGSHMRQMNNMMSSMFNPFGDAGMIGGGMNQNMGLMPFGGPGRGPMMPMMPDIGQLMQSMQNMHNMPTDPNNYSFSSSRSTVVSYGNSPDGRPQVYQESSSSRSGPGGVREVQKSVSDSRTGLKKMAIGHHIGERAHIKERQQNVYSGEREENDEFVNLDEEEADDFSKEWQQKARGGNYNQARALTAGPRSDQQTGRNQYLALPPTTSTRNEQGSPNKEQNQKRKQCRPKPYRKNPRKE